MSRSILVLLLAFALQVNGQQRPTIKNGLESFVKANTIYPIYSLENCIQGNIEVAFKVNKEGKVTYAGVTKGIGADLDAEALRLIKLTSGKWTVPAGYDTTFLIRSSMKFSLQDYGCEQLNPGSMGLAIKQYTDDMKSFSKIANFYRNIERGIENFLKESEITALKNDMGVDDDFIAKRIRIAEKKNYSGRFAKRLRRL